MRKLITICFAFMLILTFASTGYSVATRMWGRDSLVGGTKSLNNIEGMVTGDSCLVLTSAKKIYFYKYDSTNTDSTGTDKADIDPIEPLDGSGAWELIFMVNDDAGNGDVQYVWSADKIFDLLALKAPSANPALTGIGSIKIAGVIEGAVNVLGVNGAYTIGTTEATEAYGTLFISNGATPVLLMPETLVAGMSGCLMQGQGRTDVLKLDANTSDYIVLNGVRTTAAAEYVASAGAASDKICWVVGDTTDIYITGTVGTWTEE